jgi:hypothetical protein
MCTSASGANRCDHADTGPSRHRRLCILVLQDGRAVGYLVGPAPLVSTLVSRATETYLSPSMVSQSIVYDFCVSGQLHASIERAKVALAQRLEVMCDASARSPLRHPRRWLLPVGDPSRGNPG